MRVKLKVKLSNADDLGGFGLLVHNDWAVVCSAKPLRSYQLTDFIKPYMYITKLISLYYNYYLHERMLYDVFGI